MNYAETIDYLFNKTLVSNTSARRPTSRGSTRRFNSTRCSDARKRLSKQSMWQAPTEKALRHTYWRLSCKKRATGWDFTLRPTCSTSANAYVWTAKWFLKSLCARLSISFSTADTPDGNRRFSSLQQ